jgi:hypothetical protein
MIAMNHINDIMMKTGATRGSHAVTLKFADSITTTTVQRRATSKAGRQLMGNNVSFGRCLGMSKRSINRTEIVFPSVDCWLVHEYGIARGTSIKRVPLLVFAWDQREGADASKVQLFKRNNARAISALHIDMLSECKQHSNDATTSGICSVSIRPMCHSPLRM